MNTSAEAVRFLGVDGSREAGTTVAHQIRPILVEGVEYYVAYVHPTTADEYRVIDAGCDAYERAWRAGKNWRRAKREMNKAKAAMRLALRKSKH